MNPCSLDDLKPGCLAEVVELDGDDFSAQRLLALGLVEGCRIEFLRRAPLGDPIEVRINGRFNLSLRRDQARTILVYTAGLNGRQTEA